MSSPSDAVLALKELDTSSGNDKSLLKLPGTPSGGPPISENDTKHTPNIANRGPGGSSSPAHPSSAGSSTRRVGPPRLKHSNSNAGFAHQLSHKLSATFGNPTIVHRPNLHTRPALLVMREDPSPDAGVQRELDVSPQINSAPSSYNFSGSVSATELSTGKTSLESNTA